MITSIRASDHATANVGSRSVTLNDDAKNLLAGLTQNGASVPYTYDDFGNIRSKGNQNFWFDLGNRLKFSTLGGNYVYDGLGRRVQLSVDGSTQPSIFRCPKPAPRTPVARCWERAL